MPAQDIGQFVDLGQPQGYQHPQGGPSGYNKLKGRPTPREMDVLIGSQQQGAEQDLLMQRMRAIPGMLTGMSVFGFPGQ